MSGMDKANAEALFESLRGAVQAPDDEPEDGVAVKSYDDGKHWYVMLSWLGKTTAVDPETARWLAEELSTAADEADSRMEHFLMSDEVLVCRVDDFDGWDLENNPDRLPVVQYQSPSSREYPNNVGGWVMRRPWIAVFSGDMVSEDQAIAEARRLIKERRAKSE